MIINGLELSLREEEIYTGNCPPERACSAQDVAKFRAFFDGTKVPRCIHLGPETGQRQQCEQCEGKVMVKLFACAVHQKCTLAKELPGAACCLACPDYRPQP